MKTSRQFMLAGLALSLALANGVSAKAAETLVGAGATFPYPIYSKWFDAYHKLRSGRRNRIISSTRKIRRRRHQTNYRQNGGLRGLRRPDER